MTVRGKGVYSGKSTKTKFKILPERMALSAKKAVKRGIYVSWYPEKNVSGYEIQYSMNKKFRNAKIMRVTGAKKENITLKGLKPGKKYYIRIRAYKKTGGKKYNGIWGPRYGQKTK